MLRGVLVYIVASTCLAGTLSACGGGNHKGAVKRVLKPGAGSGGESGPRSKTTEAILKDSGDKACLHISSLKTLSTQMNTYSVYTADVDVGLLSSDTSTGGGEKGRCLPVFNSKSDETARALAALRDFPLTREERNQSNVMASEVIGPLLVVRPTGEACTSVDFVKGEGKSSVICTGGPSVVAVRTPSGAIRVYRLENSQLTITVYSPLKEAPTCHASLRDANLALKQTYVVAWGEGGKTVRLDRSLADMLSNRLTEPPAELNEKLHSPAQAKVQGAHGSTVVLSQKTYNDILDQIGNGRFKANCQTQGGN